MPLLGLLLLLTTGVLLVMSWGLPRLLLPKVFLWPERALPTLFLFTELDFVYTFGCILFPWKELFLPLRSSFIGAFLAGCWGYSTIPYSLWALSRFYAISYASSSLSIMIFIAFLFWRGNIIYFAFMSSFDTPSVGFLSYFTLSAYRKVFKVF